MSANVHWHEGEVTRTDRQQLLHQKGACLWFTGLSGCGKSTLAVALESELFSIGKLVYRLDGDNIRLGINSDLGKFRLVFWLDLNHWLSGFSEEDRAENIRRIGEISKLMADAGMIVLCSFVSPYRRDRDRVKRLFANAGIPFLEVFVDCSLEVVEARDPKGLYKKARAGEIKNFTGIDDPYEAPVSPDIHLLSDQMEILEELDVIMKSLRDEEILG